MRKSEKGQKLFFFFWGIIKNGKWNKNYSIVVIMCISRRVNLYVKNGVLREGMIYCLFAVNATANAANTTNADGITVDTPLAAQVAI